jgi:MFS family permease
VVSDRRVLLATSVYHLTNDAAVTVMAGEITVLQDKFSLDYSGVGVLTGIALLVTVVAQVVFGHMSDRRDPARFLPIGIAFLGIASIAVTAASTFIPFLVLVAISRVGSGFYHPVGIGWVGRAYSGKDLDRAMGFQSSFGDVGVILGIGSGALLGSAFGWEFPFVLWGVLNLLAVGVGFSLVRGHRSPPVDPPAPVDYRALLRDLRYWLLPIALAGAIFNIIANFGPILMHRGYGLSDASSGVSIALWILVGSVAAFYFGRVSARFGRYRSLLAAYLFLAIAGFVAAFLGLPAALAALWTLGSGLFITYPATFSFVSEASRTRVQGAAFGVIFGFQLAGGTLGVLTAGILADAFQSPAVPLLLAGGVAGIGFLYLLAIRSRVPAAGPQSAKVPPQL